jgi:hypothetical protein
MTQNEVRFILDIIADNWPEVKIPSVIRRIDRDEPEVLETGQRQRSIDLEDAVAISAGLAGKSREPLGTEFNYDIQTEIDLRIEAVHESEFGAISGINEFTGLTDRVKRALNEARTFPDVDPAPAPDVGQIGRVAYLDLRIVDETVQSGGRADYYRSNLTVQLRGRKQLG